MAAEAGFAWRRSCGIEVIAPSQIGSAGGVRVLMATKPVNFRKSANGLVQDGPCGLGGAAYNAAGRAGQDAGLQPSTDAGAGRG